MRAVLALYFSYVAFWSYEILTAYAHFDLSPDLYFTLSNGFDSLSNGQIWSVQMFAQQGINVLFVPLFLTRNVPLILIAFELIAASGVIPVYLIARKQKYAIFFSALFLVALFPWGIHPFAFGEEIFFPSLFLWGYYFYTIDLKLCAFLAFIFGGLTHFPFILIPAFFGFLLILGFEKGKPTRDRFGIALLSSGIVISIIRLSDVGTSFGTIGVYRDGIASPLTWLLTFLLVFGPFLFIPLLSKWSLLTIPFFVLVLLTSYPSYDYQLLNLTVHASLFIPFLILGFIPRAKWSVFIVLFLVAMSGPFYFGVSTLGSIANDESLTISQNSCGQTLDNVNLVLNYLNSSSVLIAGDQQLEVYSHSVYVYHLTDDLNLLQLYHNAEAYSKEVYSNQSVGAMLLDPYEPPGINNLVNSTFHKFLSSGYNLVADYNGVELIEKGYSGPVHYEAVRVVCDGFSTRNQGLIMIDSIYLNPGVYSTNASSGLFLSSEGQTIPLTKSFTFYSYASAEICLNSTNDSLKQVAPFTITQVN
ncbi:MAG: hypothetical protein KGN01_07435 [Patescibacteria group bacterium]|nr:hypothetical protein [Patescibacteria group bacterium]